MVGQRGTLKGPGSIVLRGKLKGGQGSRNYRGQARFVWLGCDQVGLASSTQSSAVIPRANGAISWADFEKNVPRMVVSVAKVELDRDGPCFACATIGWKN